MEVQGQVGSSGISYDFAVDAGLNAVVSIKMPIASMLAQVAAKINSPAASEVEKVLVSVIGMYLGSMPTPPPVPAPAS